MSVAPHSNLSKCIPCRHMTACDPPSYQAPHTCSGRMADTRTFQLEEEMVQWVIVWWSGMGSAILWPSATVLMADHSSLSKYTSLQKDPHSQEGMYLQASAMVPYQGTVYYQQ